MICLYLLGEGQDNDSASERDRCSVHLMPLRWLSTIQQEVPLVVDHLTYLSPLALEGLNRQDMESFPEDVIALRWPTHAKGDSAHRAGLRSASAVDHTVLIITQTSMPKPLVLTAHARIRLHGRHLDPKWIEETARQPDWTEAEPQDPSVERRFRAIPEFGGRILRVACVETSSNIRVISVMFDRNARRKP